MGRLDRIQLERTACECLTDWQGLLAGQPVQARQMLKKLLEGRLVFTPTHDGTAVEFRGTGVLDPVPSRSARVPQPRIGSDPSASGRRATSIAVSIRHVSKWYGQGAGDVHALDDTCPNVRLGPVA